MIFPIKIETSPLEDNNQDKKIETDNHNVTILINLKFHQKDIKLRGYQT